MSKDQQLNNAITELWHCSRVALTGQQDQSRSARMLYVRDELRKRHADLLLGLSPKRLWFRIEDQTNPLKPVTK